MRIGIDIDGVLTNMEAFLIDYLSKYCVENNINFSIGDSNYHVSKTFHITHEQGERFWEEYLEYYAIHEPARPFAGEVIKKLKEEGNEIYIITARWGGNREDEIGEKMRAIVRNWLSEYGIIYDKLIFAKASGEKKAWEMQEYQIDIMIEDNPNNVKELSKITKVICYNTGYNQDCIGENITRCYSWYDIYKTIMKV